MRPLYCYMSQGHENTCVYGGLRVHQPFSKTVLSSLSNLRASLLRSLWATDVLGETLQGWTNGTRSWFSMLTKAVTWVRDTNPSQALGRGSFPPASHLKPVLR